MEDWAAKSNRKESVYMSLATALIESEPCIEDDQKLWLYIEVVLLHKSLRQVSL